MIYLKNISLNNYRNFLNKSFSFENSCNVIVGDNGSGKTNILESISLFDKGRGFRKEKISNLINNQNKNGFFVIQSLLEHEKNDYRLKIFNSENNTKKLSINESSDKESTNHFQSLFSLIYFLPEMERLFLSSPSYRRNFLDRLIYTFFKQYNSVVNNYKKAINERQALLKKDYFDESWIEKLELDIVKFGSVIYDNRLDHIKKINKIIGNLTILENNFYNFYLKIYDVFLDNFSNIYKNEDEYLSELKKNRKIDLYSGGCSVGPHRSDIIGFSKLDEFNINQFSTGQQKSIIILIIIAQCMFLIENYNIKPIILLDEVCSHLDNHNRELLLYLINDLNLQVFMTGTEKKYFSFLSTKAHYCNIT